MKKILKTTAVALAGMLALALAACTDGNGEFKPEKPTYFNKVSDENGNEKSVTAVWDFSDVAAFPKNYAVTEVSEIKPSSPADGTGNAKLVYRSGLAKDLTINEGKNLRVGSSTNASLTNLKDAKGSFELTINGQSNIQIYAYSDSNGGNPSTFVAVYKKDGNAIAEKASTERDNLPVYVEKDSDRNPTLGLEGAAAGTYVIYANAASIAKIDVNATSPFYSESAIPGIVLGTHTLIASGDDKGKIDVITPWSDDKIEEVRLAREFPLPSVYPIADKEITEKKTLSAKWEIVGEKTVAKIVDNKTLVATYEGTVIARARVGRYAKDFTVKVVGTVNDFKLENPETTLTMEAFTESLQFKVTENDGDISKFVTWEIVPVSPADKKIATVTAEGKVSGSEAGKIKVKASFKDGKDNEFAKESDEITITPCDKIIVTLLDRESENFPEIGATILQNEWEELVENTTTIKNSETLTKENFEMTFLDFGKKPLWKIASISVLADSKDPSKRNETYPGIAFTKDGQVISMDKGSMLFSFDVTIKPEQDKALKLTSVKLALQTNQVAVDKIEVSKDDTVLVSETVNNKNAKDFIKNLVNGESISEETVLTFTVTTNEYKKKDKEHFSLSDIKLFFEKES